MEKKLNAWIQSPDYTIFDIGEISITEISRLWGSRWAQKCIRDAADAYDVRRFSPHPLQRVDDFCSPQLGFDNGNAHLAVSPHFDVNPSIQYGVPLQEFNEWTVSLNIKGGRKLFGVLPADYSFETAVSTADALDIVRIFYDTKSTDLRLQTRSWRKQVEKDRPLHFVTALFF